MREIFKRHYKDICLVALYTILAIAVYLGWFHSIWHKWYIDLITAIVLCIVGAVSGFFYVRYLDKEQKKKEAEIEEASKEGE